MQHLNKRACFETAALSGYCTGGNWPAWRQGRGRTHRLPLRCLRRARGRLS